MIPACVKGKDVIALSLFQFFMPSQLGRFLIQEVHSKRFKILKKKRPIKTSYKMAVSCLGYDEDFKIQIYENNFQKKFKGQMKKS